MNLPIRIFAAPRARTRTFSLERIRSLLIACALVLTSGDVLAVAITVSANTNWSAIATGSGPGGQPAAADTITISGNTTLTVNVANGVCASITIGSVNTSGATLLFNSGSHVTVSGNVQFGNGGGNRDGSIDMTNGGLLTAQSFSISNINNWAPGTGTLELTANNTLPNDTNFDTFNNLTITSGTTTLGRNTTVSGNLLVNGTLAGAQTLTLNGTSKTVDGTGSITNTGTLSITTGAKSIASSANLSVSGTIAVTGAIAVTNNGTITTTAAGGITGSAAGSTWTNAAGSTLNISGPLLATGTLNASANPNTVNYAGAGQTVKLPSGAPATYYNLTLSGSGAKTMPAAALTISNNFTTSGSASATAGGALTIGNDVVLGSGTTFSASTFSHSLAGDFSNNGATFNANTSTVTFNGSLVQAIAGTAATTFNNLTINKTGDVTIACGTPSPTVNGTLALTSGKIITSGTSPTCSTACSSQVPVIVGAAGTISGGSSSSYVQGALRKNFNAFGALNFRGVAGQDEFPIGTSSGYSPIEITAGLTLTAGNVVACVTATDDPNMTPASGGGIDTAKSVNRYWSMTSTTINNALVLMDATFKFAAGDVDGGAATGNFIVERYDGTDWNPTTLVTAGATSTRAQNINISSSANEFQIGEPLTSFPSVLGAFNAFDTSTPAGAVLGVIQTKQAGVSFSLRVVRIANNAVDATYNGANIQVQLVDASNNSGGFTTGCRSTWTTQIGTVNVTFASGIATATFPVGQIPNVFKDVRVRVGGGAGCSTDPFAIRPTSITLDAADADWQNPGTTRALTNTSYTGGVVHAASDPAAASPRAFTLRATPQAAGAQSASNYNGSPTIVTGFPACISPPASCSSGSLSFTGGSWVGTGTRTNPTAHYTEAGVFNLQLEDATYASVDSNDGSTAATRTVPATATASIGRFVPDRFTFTGANIPQFQTFGSACGARSFTYIGQPFWYVTLPSATVQAVNAAGNVTTNYKNTGVNGLFKLTASGIAETYGNNGTGPAPDPASIGTPSFTPATGTGVYGAAPTAKLSYTRSTSAPVLAANNPFTANLSLTVNTTDNSETGPSGNPAIGALTSTIPLVFNGSGAGIAFDSGAAFRYGQLVLRDVFAPLNGNPGGQVPLLLEARYWDGTTFAANTLDNCSSFIAQNFVLYSHAGAVTTTNMVTPTAGSTGNINIPIAAPLTLSSGSAFLNVSRPSPAIAAPGSVRVCLDLDVAAGGNDPTCQSVTPSNKTYLQGRWTASNYDQDPSARAALGLFGSQPRNFIFQRENF